MLPFTDESLHLRLVSQAKGFSLASLRGPIAVAGTFKTPTLRPELGGPAARGGLALALGAVTAGIGALLPLLEFGKNKDSNCAALTRSQPMAQNFGATIFEISSTATNSVINESRYLYR